MKKAVLFIPVLALLCSAGPLGTATFPLRHPKKDAHAVKSTIKGLYRAGKAVLW